MKRLVLSLVSLLFGVCIGWYFGYTRPVAKQYRYLRDHYHMTDQQMAEAGAQVRDNLPQFIEGMKRTDELTAAVALGTFKRLEQGNVDGAKKLLLPPMGGYYRRYHAKGGDQGTLAKIEEAARQYPEIAAELARKVE